MFDKNPRKFFYDILPPERAKKAHAKRRQKHTIATFLAKKITTELEPKIIIKEASSSFPRHFRTAALVVFTIITLLIGSSLIGFLSLKTTLATNAPSIYEKFKKAGHALTQFEIKEAYNSFTEIDQEIELIGNKVNRYGLFQLTELWGTAVPQLKEIPVIFKNIADLSKSAISFTNHLEILKQNSFHWLTHQNGSEFRNELKGLTADVTHIGELNVALQNQSQNLGYEIGGELLNLNTDLYQLERFLTATTKWIEGSGEKNILVLFQNPSEIRPTGGFIGSYAVLTITRDGLQEIKVWNVYDPDGQLAINVIPPKQLQGITPWWGARDANWFFDFPTSAEKVMYFLESSKIYLEQNTVFDGVLAMNIHVLESILEITGSIELEEYDKIISPENFLYEIQHEVEVRGKDFINGEPKRILKVLTPLIFEKLADLEEDQKKQLFQSFKDHIDKKNIMLYFRNPEMQRYLKNTGIAGDVYELPYNFRGDYLAVVNTNIAGGKTDAFIEQDIKLSSKIDINGRIDNFLIIERTHTGQNQKDPWYRTTNQNYIKIFTPNGSSLSYSKGETAKTIKPVKNYAATNHLFDSDLKALEDSEKLLEPYDISELKESGKTVFATWFNVRAGKTEQLELQYSNPNKLLLQRKETPYEFIFERQSGVKSSLDVLIEAPGGYIWKETGSSNFNYVDDDPPGRLSIPLTLVPTLLVDQN